ncbi:hypothetical protein EVAR_53841_1 [Eumeta japonica]|uniref:Uncharacterized protein n=1 Tax=Eumeta variegata TaxID=151549 RepID=A0A4C1ZHV0_EUMVA|nr:hypothetical protein EVAR_53841_1 [Eumeta japonica]
MNVAYALNEVYSGIYSSMRQVRSLQLKRYSNTKIPKNLPKTLYLIYTLVEKEYVIVQRFRKAERSRFLTIHEAQSLTSEGTVIVRTTVKQKLHDKCAICRGGDYAPHVS